MKVTKKHIRENIRSTELAIESKSLGRAFNHWYQHGEYEAFELTFSDPVVIHHVHHHSFEIDQALNKEQFIDAIYNFLNS